MAAIDQHCDQDNVWNESVVRTREGEAAYWQGQARAWREMALALLNDAVRVDDKAEPPRE